MGNTCSPIKNDILVACFSEGECSVPCLSSQVEGKTVIST